MGREQRWNMVWAGESCILFKKGSVMVVGYECAVMILLFGNDSLVFDFGRAVLVLVGGKNSKENRGLGLRSCDKVEVVSKFGGIRLAVFQSRIFGLVGNAFCWCLRFEKRPTVKANWQRQAAERYYEG